MAQMSDSSRVSASERLIIKGERVDAGRRLRVEGQKRTEVEYK